jgi:hypothetical protein
MTAETKLPAMTAGSFRKTGGARAHLPTCAAADYGNLIRHRAEYVEDHIIHEDGYPGEDCDDSQSELGNRVSYHLQRAYGLLQIREQPKSQWC